MGGAANVIMSVTGKLLDCIIKLSINCFPANQVEASTKLFPAVFVKPTTKNMFQFELGRIKVIQLSLLNLAKILFIFLSRFCLFCGQIWRVINYNARC